MATARSTQESPRRFSEIFEREVAVFFVATGTAANALSMSACNRIGGVAFCHAEAHMTVDEFGAMGFFTGGARTAPVPGALGRIDPQALDRAITRFSHDLAPAGQPMAVTITQATEIGTVYALDDIAAVSAVAKKHGLPLHMDGARFANALAALDVTPAEMTWKSGVDIVSFVAWGKPVMHSPFDRKRRTLLIAFAGPMMNVILAFIVAVTVILLVRFEVVEAGSRADVALHFVVQLNFILFFFNLLPVPPLDGGHVAEASCRTAPPHVRQVRAVRPVHHSRHHADPADPASLSVPARWCHDTSTTRSRAAHQVNGSRWTIRSPSTSSRGRSICCFTS